jgi:L-ascorbate metabolism protein UlaG (beta-lactamase superfamily)
MGGHRLLVDPMLSDEGVLPSEPGSPRPRPNPLVPLPKQAAALVGGVEAVLLTQLHSDHFDPAARALLRRDRPVLCQPADLEALIGDGFEDVRPVPAASEWRGLRLVRKGGRHGRGEAGARMGPVSGWVLSAPHERTLYIAGDTLWAPEVEEALAAHRPGVVVLNAGAAQVADGGGPITMTADDVASVAAAAPSATVVCVHIDAFDHCVLSREDLRARLAAEGLDGRVLVPEDGEALDFGA